MSIIKITYSFLLYDKEIPPDNNGTKKGVQNIKLKISGQFKTGHKTIYKIAFSILTPASKAK